MGPHVSGCDGFASADSIFPCPRANIRWVQIRTRTHARGFKFVHVSLPVGFDTRRYADNLYRLPSSVTMSCRVDHTMSGFLLFKCTYTYTTNIMCMGGADD